ncbi:MULTISPECIES: AEC family transporter [Clostridium]|uniref:AEC family transporter n=1 Tax=Clostridium TaxID=1485 RepID=UPI000B1D1F57|nr:AEC family transporter [Clostridium sp. DMHC 10]
MFRISSVNYQFISFVIIITLSYILKRFGLIKEADGDGMARILFNVTLPALIIDTFNSMKLDSSLIILTIIGAIYGLAMSFLGVFIFRKAPQNVRGALSMVVPGFNVGLFAYPIIEAIFGKPGLKYIGMFDIGNSIPIFVFCYIIASLFSTSEANIGIKEITKKSFASLPLMSYIIALLINLSGLHFPSPVISICKIISKANMPLSLLLLGVCLNFSIDKIYYKSIAKILFVRYSFGLVIGIILFFVLPFNLTFRYTILIGLILPIGMAVIPYAVQFNYDKKLVGTLCNITMILSFIMIWIITNLQ